MNHNLNDILFVENYYHLYNLSNDKICIISHKFNIKINFTQIYLKIFLISKIFLLTRLLFF